MLFKILSDVLDILTTPPHLLMNFYFHLLVSACSLWGNYLALLFSLLILSSISYFYKGPFFILLLTYNY